MNERRALLVVGMHYGGTAAVARSLSLFGATPPRTPFAPEGDGEAHWGESDPIVATHDELLASAGSSWDDILPFPADWHRSSPAASEYAERMAAIVVGEYLDSSLFLVNDPRICRLVPFWLRLLDELEARPAFVLPLRDPREVVGLLTDRKGFSASKALLLWLRHVLDAERDTRGYARSFVAYGDLLRDPVQSMRATVQRVGVDLPHTGDPPEIELDELRLADEPCPSGRAPEDPRDEVVGWVKKAYLSLSDGCRSGNAPDPKILDSLSAALSDADRTYGDLLAESRLRADQLLKDLTARDRRLETVERLREHASTRFRKSEAKLRESERQRRAAQAALASVLESPSWRLTRPLRATKALINRVRGVGKRP